MWKLWKTLSHRGFDGLRRGDIHLRSHTFFKLFVFLSGFRGDGIREGGELGRLGKARKPLRYLLL